MLVRHQVVQRGNMAVVAFEPADEDNIATIRRIVALSQLFQKQRRIAYPRTKTLRDKQNTIPVKFRCMLSVSYLIVQYECRKQSTPNKVYNQVAQTSPRCKL